MLATALFVLSLVALLGLFGLKSLELRTQVRTPLAHFRRVGDPLVTEHWQRWCGRCRTTAATTSRAYVSNAERTVRKSRFAFDAAMHALAARLNRYLRGRRIEIRQNGNGNVSQHLKTVLQKADDTTPPNAL